MRRKSLFITACALATCLTVGTAFSGSGQEVFSSLKCGMCHKANKKAAAVSLADISKTYETKSKLVELFNNKDPKPLIPTEKWGMMLPHFQDIHALGAEDKEALADYILSFK